MINQRGSTNLKEYKEKSKNKKTAKVKSEIQRLLDQSAKMEDSGKNNRSRKIKRTRPIKYAAKQVISRGDQFEPDKTISTGTNLIGKLLTSIDTREKGQFYKVLLPYGGKGKTGAEIPKNTVLLGKISYPGKGEKVFIKFSRGVLPNGKEFSIEAQALDTEKYSPGISGEFHGKGNIRIATTLGLTMVSGMTDVLTEKQELGRNGAVAAKATLKNGLYKGLSQASQVEAQRQASELASEPEYLTVDSGKDLIVNLTRSFKIE